MIYQLHTETFDKWCMTYRENTHYVSADSEEEAIQIYKKNFKVGRKKVYVEQCNKKGVIKFV